MIKILILEDEARERLDMQALFSEEFDCKIVASSQKVMEALKQEDPNYFDLLICDIVLDNEDVNGIQVAAQVLKSHNIPVVFLTKNSKNTTQFTDQISKIGVPLGNFFTKTELDHDFAVFRDKLLRIIDAFEYDLGSSLDLENVPLGFRDSYGPYKFQNTSEIICVMKDKAKEGGASFVYFFDGSRLDISTSPGKIGNWVKRHQRYLIRVKRGVFINLLYCDSLEGTQLYLRRKDRDKPLSVSIGQAGLGWFKRHKLLINTGS